MSNEMQLMAFGPIPSRRLGQSIGINNIPPKICTYSCIYCQLGKTTSKQTKRQQFYEPDEIVNAVKNKVKKAKEKEEPIDYLSFVPDGEPTLDSNLGKEIERLKELDIKIAVISNASLLWEKDIRDQLSSADWVSLKIDTVDHDIWQRMNRPHRALRFENILDGISRFSHSFNGILTTETMLLQNVNDKNETVEKTADFIAGLTPKKSYLSAPIRPPAESWINPASEFELNTAYQIFKERGINTEYLVGYEGNTFGYTGDIEEDILSITSVHPIREDALIALLKKADKGWSIIEKLLREDKLMKVEYRDHKFYVRRLPKKDVVMQGGDDI
jgi:wyosine [tRNA(Phe)-imidazoG37] synthetase (radical SAM superfamily)